MKDLNKKSDKDLVALLTEKKKTIQEATMAMGAYTGQSIASLKKECAVILTELNTRGVDA